MRLVKSIVLTAAIAIVATAPTAVQADETGFAGMHSWSKVGKKTCMTDHTHYGSSSGHKTKRRAMAAAIKDWQEFNCRRIRPVMGLLPPRARQA